MQECVDYDKIAIIDYKMLTCGLTTYWPSIENSLAKPRGAHTKEKMGKW